MSQRCQQRAVGSVAIDGPAHSRAAPSNLNPCLGWLTRPAAVFHVKREWSSRHQAGSDSKAGVCRPPEPPLLDMKAPWTLEACVPGFQPAPTSQVTGHSSLFASMSLRARSCAVRCQVNRATRWLAPPRVRESPGPRAVARGGPRGALRSCEGERSTHFHLKQPSRETKFGFKTANISKGRQLRSTGRRCSLGSSTTTCGLIPGRCPSARTHAPHQPRCFT